MRCIAVFAGMAVVLSGCASTLTTFFERGTRKEHIIKAGDKAPEVGGISLNSTRRLVISKAGDSKRFTCSEPAPDTGLNQALQTAISASASAEGATKKPEASIGFSDTSILTNIILSNRTELVELWRTTTYAYCLLLMNGKDDDAKTYLNSAVSVINNATATSVARANAAQAVASANAEASKSAAASKLEIAKLPSERSLVVAPQLKPQDTLTSPK